MPVSLIHDVDVSILHLGDDENWFTSAWLDRVESCLDEAVHRAPAALVTVGDGKFYSNGLDVTLLTGDPEAAAAYSARVQRLFSRILTAPIPSIAAVNGHAFGAGAMLALAHDFRLMDAERGFFCFPEVNIKIPFTSGMAALIQSKLTPAAAVEAMTTGRRYGGPDALMRGLVDRTVAPEQLLAAAIETAQALGGKDAATLGAIKAMMFASPASALAR
ncbi:enoyl-CoA hydratase/isomerase family protein [Microbacterium sp. NPDC077663]|uniref:enoyl-CoA hydratase/isomerase family protein n=1 Tax=Microbacterium sp. NPDC077663 TaxID=3364189 RepID=UPI0037C8943D